jgi:hypothetical protein
MTNVINFHTCTASGVDLIIALVLVTQGQLLQVACDVIGRTSISVPVCINIIGVERRADKLLICYKIFIEVVPTFSSTMTLFEAYLAAFLVVGVARA